MEPSRDRQLERGRKTGGVLTLGLRFSTATLAAGAMANTRDQLRSDGRIAYKPGTTGRVPLSHCGFVANRGCKSQFGVVKERSDGWCL